ncbi:HAD hydrolase-like protein [candidate division KSB1 bacterium]|nr:HAD hydrolase-like protein [candidate division KSB1 bacterium]
MKLLLWDIDGTLIMTGGAGMRAMDRAFKDLFNVEKALQGVNMAGRTDTSIIQDAMKKYGIHYSEPIFQQYKEQYYRYIAEEIQVDHPEKMIMNGIQELLETLEKRQDIVLALLTGNWEKSGRIKLAHFGLDRYFEFGAFADDSGIRNDLLPFAIKRFQERYGYVPDKRHTYIIGDTPADINCAKPYDVVSVAVAAAHYSRHELLVYEPDYLFDDFSDLQEVTKIF